MYTIALEGWRRGLSLKFNSYKNGNKKDIRYSLSDGMQTHHFEGSGGDLNTDEAVAVCDDKGLTKQHLAASSVPVPPGKSFGIEATMGEIIEFANKVGFPVVLKPIDDKGGNGVFVHLRNEHELAEALNESRRKECSGLLIEEHIEGEEVRVYVLAGQVLAATKRVPAHVIGDGEKSIKELIDQKNDDRKNIPHLRHRPIKIDDKVKRILSSSNLSMESIPKAGETIFLRRTSNISTGGEPIDVTDMLTAEQKNTAVKAVSSIPGLMHGGVDLLVSQKYKAGAVLEVNAKPGLGSHLFPIEGEAKDIPGMMLDYYFPKTKKMPGSNSNVYFDFQTIKSSLDSGTLREIKVTDSPASHLAAKVYKITGDLDPVTYLPWFQKKVLEKELHGFMKKKSEDTTEIMVAGSSKAEVDAFYEVFSHGSIKSLIAKIEEEDWTKPVKMGFELIDGSRSLSVQELENKIVNTLRSYERIIKDKEKVEHQINKVSNSRMWKWTSFIRKLGKPLRKK
ncbi:ATP-grasp domain-containing protein [Virgibacillus xinjiangensis]|uniref:Acylphosphatase n=1 Tax=Virgibacillus xinjiangensis TaxID=393090 RepID=A0ABV7CU10_9BACI